MAELPKPERGTPQLLYDVYQKRAKPGGRSRRLGGSVIGKACERALWYGFRWASAAGGTPNGRSLRLMSTGNEQEPFVCDALREGGIELFTEQPDAAKPQQIEYTDVAGHAVVYLDGIGRGFPESPAKWHVLSLKLANAKRWKGVATKGLEAAEPVYFAQSQFEMALSKVDRTLLLIRNRDTEELHAERIRFVPDTGAQLLAKAQRIIASDRPLSRISDDPAFFECKLCDHSETCHGGALPAASCRTCIHATAELDGHARWSCAKYGKDLTPKLQEIGCPSHVYVPDLLEKWATHEDATETGIVYRNTLTGGTFEQGPQGITSTMLLALDKALIGDPVIAELVDRFDGTVIPA